MGHGHIILIGFRTQWRGQSHGTYKFMFNALYYNPRWRPRWPLLLSRPKKGGGRGGRGDAVGVLHRLFQKMNLDAAALPDSLVECVADFEAV